jgi:hypothetical protein
MAAEGDKLANYIETNYEQIQIYTRAIMLRLRDTLGERSGRNHLIQAVGAILEGIDHKLCQSYITRISDIVLPGYLELLERYDDNRGGVPKIFLACILV